MGVSGFAGQDSFTYQASDGELLSNVATVSLTVTPVNDAPVANPDEASTDEDVAVTLAVLGNDTPEASLPGQVCYTGEWYDYETKYGAGQTTFQIPAPLSPETTWRVRDLAVRAFKAIDCAGMARVDFFVEDDNRVLVNEINTIPGFTSISMYPKLWQASGMSYGELLDRLIQLAIERHRVRAALKTAYRPKTDWFKS